MGQNFSWIEQVGHMIDKEYDDNEQENSETKAEVFALKTEVCADASRSKAKAKPWRPSTTCSSSRTLLILERTWIDNEPGAQFDQAYPAAKRPNTLLQDPSGQDLLYLRALQGHSGRNPIDPTLQDNVLIPSYWMCSQFTLHHKFRIDSGRTKFKQGKTDGILYSRESHE